MVPTVHLHIWNCAKNTGTSTGTGTNSPKYCRLKQYTCYQCQYSLDSMYLRSTRTGLKRKDGLERTFLSSKHKLCLALQGKNKGCLNLALALGIEISKAAYLSQSRVQIYCIIFTVYVYAILSFFFFFFFFHRFFSSSANSPSCDQEQGTAQLRSQSGGTAREAMCSVRQSTVTCFLAG